MALAPQHTFMVLTKRPAEMQAYLNDRTLEQWAVACVPGTLPMTQFDVERALGVRPKFSSDPPTPVLPLRNVWLGVTAEDQPRADERIPELLATPAAVRFVSYEPAIGPLNTAWALSHPLDIAAGFLRRGRFSPGLETLRPLDWVICGGESGPGARPMHPQWARDVRDQCAAAVVPFLFKQWGEWAPGECSSRAQVRAEEAAWLEDEGWYVRKITIGASECLTCDDEPDVWRIGKRRAGRTLDGVIHDARPQVAA